MGTISFALPDVLSFAGALLLRVTLLLSGTLLLAQLLEHSSARARHAFWSVTAVALLLLPFLPPALPSLPIPVPAPVARWMGEDRSGGLSLELSAEAASGGPTAIVATPTTSTSDDRSINGQAAFDGGRDAPIPIASASPAADLRAVGTWGLILLWIAGTIAAVLSLMLGLYRVQRIARMAHPVRERAWQDGLASARARVGVKRPVALRSTPSTRTPLAGGFLRAFVLVPSSAAHWCAERRDLVLLHEMVHVARHDALRQVIGRLAEALYWFHPLARIASRKALLAREQACDETVVALGHKPSTYARHLLELAEPGGLPLPALSLLGRPHLEKRVMAILKPSPRPGRRVTVVAAACASLWAIAVAAVAPAKSNPPLAAGLSAPAQVTFTPPSWQSTEGPGQDIPFLALEAPQPSPLPAPAFALGLVPFTRLPAPPVQERSCWEVAASDTVGASGERFTIGNGDTEAEQLALSGGDRLLRVTTGDTRLCMRTHGSVTFADDGARIEFPGADSWIVMGSRDPRRTVEMVITPMAGGLTYDWFVDGSRRELDASGIEWREAMLSALFAYWELPASQAELQALLEADHALRYAQLSAVRDELRARAETAEALRREQAALRGVVDSARTTESRAQRAELELQLARELEALRAQMEAVRSRAVAGDSTQVLLRQQAAALDAIRAEVERRRAEIAAGAPMSDSVAAQVRRTREEREEMLRANRQLAEVARVEAMRSVEVRRTEVEARERRFREADARFQERIGRVKEAIRRIP